MIWQDLLINFVDKHEVVYVYMVNIRVNVDKTLDKDLFHIIKTATDCPPKLASNKTRYATFFQIGTITQKLIISELLCFLLTES